MHVELALASILKFCHRNDLNDTFGLDETVRFFQQNAENEAIVIDEEEDLDVDFTAILDLNSAYDEYINRPKQTKPLLVQRDERMFWNLIFRQKFDLSNTTLNFRFAREAGADAGGPMGEFLTLCMRRINLIDGLFFGQEEKLAFRLNSEALLANQYYKVGQLIALSILILGRGPECFHPIIVREMYGIDQPKVIESIDDGFINQSIREIYAENYDCLLDLNIYPRGKSKDELIRLFLISKLLHSKSGAIEQVKRGIKSVQSCLKQSTTKICV